MVGLTGAIFVVLWAHGGSVAFEAILAVLVLSCGLFGGWLWRYRNGQRSIAL
jgi:hypothetical protein